MMTCLNPAKFFLVLTKVVYVFRVVLLNYIAIKLLSIFSNAGKMPAIFVFTETSFNHGKLQNINSFQSFHTLRLTGCSGGVSTYVRNHFIAKPVSALCFTK